jgi:hypothetical protein
VAADKITDKENLERWLQNRPLDNARVIVARSAMRAAPALESAGQKLGPVDKAPTLILGAFRAYAVVRSSATYPDRAASLRFAGYAASTARVVDFPAISATDAARAAAEAAHNHLSNVLNANCVADAVRAARFAGPETDASFWADWTDVSADALTLERGASPPALAASPLWPNGAPKWAERKWEALKIALRSRPSDHWDVWIDWYEARLRGELGNEEEEIARVLEVTADEWAAGPGVANKKIKEIAARFKLAASSGPIVGQVSANKHPTFISHASRVDGARAATLAQHLEAAGISCWIAPRDIPSGADWNSAIMSAIDACGAMILLVSEAALESPFVKAEVQHAFERKKRVLPIRLADTFEAGRIDMRLKIVQHIDGRGENHTIVANILKSLG